MQGSPVKVRNMMEDRLLQQHEEATTASVLLRHWGDEQREKQLNSYIFAVDGTMCYAALRAHKAECRRVLIAIHTLTSCGLAVDSLSS